MIRRSAIFIPLLVAGLALLHWARQERLGCTSPPAIPASASDGESLRATGLADAADAWPIFRGDAALRGLARGGSLHPPLKRAWSFQTAGPVKSSPIVVNQTLYIGSHDGKVYALHAPTGHKRWEFATGDQVEAPPLYVEGTIYVGSADGFLYALEADTGRLRWRFEAGDKILGSANVLRDAEENPRGILVGSYDNHVYALAPDDGSLLWSYAADHFIHGAPAVAANRVVLGACDGKMHVLAADTGQLLRKMDLGGPIASSPAVDGNRAYLGGYHNRFVAVHLPPPPELLDPPEFRQPPEIALPEAPCDASALAWTYQDRSFPYFSSAAVTGEKVVFGGRDRRLHALDQATGRRLWVFQARHKIDSSPVVAGETLIVGSDDGRLYLLSLHDGTLLGSYNVGSPIVGSPAVVDGRVFVGADDGRVYALESTKP